MSKFNMIKIGRLEAGGGRLVIGREFLRGLLHLDGFSHIHVFGVCGGLFVHRIAAIVSLNAKDGTAELEGDFPGGTDVLDIKPYMPSEDRFLRSSGYASGSEIKEITEKKPGVLSLDTTGDGYGAAANGRVDIRNGKTMLVFDGDYAVNLPEDFRGRLKLYWYFDRCDRPAMRRTLVCRPPYKAPKTGGFASRSPVRPNPIAMTVVGVEAVDAERSIVWVEAFDALKNTPVLAFSVYGDADCIDEVSVPSWLSHWPLSADSAASGDGPSHMGGPDDFRNLESGNCPADRPGYIELRGVRQNNLKNIDAGFPVGAGTDNA